MKGLNKIALATAVAAAPFATQAMEPMNDNQMGDVTGQAGVTIELETQVDIGQIEYDQGTNSSFVMQDMSIGGVFEDSLGITMDIDLVGEGYDRSKPGQDLSAVDAQRVARDGDARAFTDGDALISLGSRNDGSGGDNPEPADVSFSIDAMGLSTGAGDLDPDASGPAPVNQELGGDENSALLMSNLDMNVFISQLDIIASNNEAFDSANDTNTGSIGIDVAFTLGDLNLDMDVAAVSISEMNMAGVGSLAALRGADDDAMAGLAVSNPATVSMDIGAGNPLEGFTKAGLPDGEDALRVSIDHFQGDMYIGDIGLGTADNNSIGSLAISNLRVTDTEMAIYGRE